MLFWKGGRSKSWKNWAPKTLANIDRQKKTLKWVLKKYFFIIFLKSNNIVWPFDSQLQLNCQEIHCLHEISFDF